MTMPHERMRAFLRAGEILWDIVDTSVHIKTWGAELPERLVDEAKMTLCHYPSPLELEWAADGQRSMHTWMAREIRDIEQQDNLFGRLKEAAAQVAAQMASDGMPFDGDAFLHAWLIAEHPALGYRAPAELLDKTSNPEMFVRLFLAELSVSFEARRVFRSVSKAYRWLRRGHPSLRAIPLEILHTDAGRLRVMAELHRLARGEPAD